MYATDGAVAEPGLPGVIVLDRDLRSVSSTAAVTLRAASASETSCLLCRAYALTQREREVVAAIVDGLDTRAVSTRLFISQHTVQDHLKSVFGKIGIHSRRELLATFSASAN
jgi:DNA-binding CsgD family transcriptional regulator